MIGLGVGLTDRQIHPIQSGHADALLEESGFFLLLEDGASHLLL